MLNFKMSSIFYYCLPPAICLLTIVFWIIEEIDNSIDFISIFSTILNVIIIPLYLIILNLLIKDIAIYQRIILSFSSNILSILIHYFNYGITTSTLLSPDYATKIIFRYEVIISCAILAIFFIIAFLFKLMKVNT
jgi:hypothetical protein